MKRFTAFQHSLSTDAKGLVVDASETLETLKDKLSRAFDTPVLHIFAVRALKSADVEIIDVRFIRDNEVVRISGDSASPASQPPSPPSPSANQPAEPSACREQSARTSRQSQTAAAAAKSSPTRQPQSSAAGSAATSPSRRESPAKPLRRTTPPPPAEAPSDWLTLNVGGRIFSAGRSTMAAAAPDSMLARMFAAEGTGLLAAGRTNSSGQILIDRSPRYFEPLLNYLRTGVLVLDGWVSAEAVYEEAKASDAT